MASLLSVFLPLTERGCESTTLCCSIKFPMLETIDPRASRFVNGRKRELFDGCCSLVGSAASNQSVFGVWSIVWKYVVSIKVKNTNN